jgi:hypothetical protein
MVKANSTTRARASAPECFAPRGRDAVQCDAAADPFSVAAAMRASVATASSGNFPTADSAESMTASVPSKTALATSVASARVGRRLVVMDSNIWVAVITGFPARLARAIRFFCVSAMPSRGTSTPKSPRATMTPSAAAKISSKVDECVRSFDFGDQERIPPQFLCAAVRTASRSAAVSTND